MQQGPSQALKQASSQNSLDQGQPEHIELLTPTTHLCYYSAGVTGKQDSNMVRTEELQLCLSSLISCTMLLKYVTSKE